MRKTKHMQTLRAVAVVAALGLGLAGCGGDSGETDDASGSASASGSVAAEGSVSFTSPSGGDTVSSPVTLEMAADGLTIEPADAGVNEGAGHLHVIVDDGCVAAGEAIPKDETHVHFGDGSTSGELELEPGEHTLCLQFADAEHVASDITEEITITVE